MPKETVPISRRPIIGKGPDVAMVKPSQRHILIAKAMADLRKKKEEENEVARGKRPSPASCWVTPGPLDAIRDSDRKEE